MEKVVQVVKAVLQVKVELQDRKVQQDLMVEVH